ncbi:MAG: DUF1127 domain-containing protein [Paracoccaceae bacterium]
MTINAIEGFIPRRAEKRAALRKRLELRRQRRALARLSDHLLTDVGLTRAEAEREARRALWDVPGHWLA